MFATKIMIIRHAERPDVYAGTSYYGVSPTSDACGDDATKHLTTLGWQRAGALVTLFAPPWGPKSPTLETPNFLFASKPTNDAPNALTDDIAGGGPSQRPSETLIPLAQKLQLKPNLDYGKNEYSDMVSAALACDGVVLVAWQHEDIPLLNRAGQPGLSRSILDKTNTSSTFTIPTTWLHGPQGARYDLVWVFDRPEGEGPIQSFTLFTQRLLPGDQP